jgi:hypothetical protein
MRRDLVQTQPHRQHLCPPQGWPGESRVLDGSETLVGHEPGGPKELEDVCDASRARSSEPRLGWSEAIAGQPAGRDTQWLVVATRRRIFDLRPVAKLHRHRMPKHVPQGPVAISRAVEKVIRPSDEQADHFAIGRLGQVEDPFDLRPRGGRCSRGQGLLSSEQVIEERMHGRRAAGPDGEQLVIAQARERP